MLMNSGRAREVYCVSAFRLQRPLKLLVAALGARVLLMGLLSSTADANPPDLELCIVTFGDSTTVGYAVDDSYPQKLARCLFEQGVSATVVNSGVNGDTTAGARERFERDVLAHSPAVVVIQFGLNDQTVRLYQKPDEVKSYLTESQFSANLQYFIGELRQRGIQVILMTPNPMCWTPTLEGHYPEGPYLDGPRGGNLLLQRYLAAVQQLAKSDKVPLVDVFAEYDQYERSSGRPIQELFLEDGVHPNEVGYDLNVKLLWKKLLPLISAKMPATAQRVMRPFSVIRDGKPHSAYIIGWGCRRQEGYFELTRTEHERNPRDCLSSPVPLDQDWEVQLEVTTLDHSEWSLELGDSGHISYSSVSGTFAIDGPIFVDFARDRFALGREFSSRAMSLVLICKGQRLELRINGTDVVATDVALTDLGPVRISPKSGTIQVRNFRVL